MSQTFQCGDNTALVSYLYDECEAGDRAAIDAHVALCAACAAEVAALESARLQLASWTPPEAELAFQIVRPQASAPGAGATHASPLQNGSRGPSPAVWWSRPLPAWAQAVAASLIFAAGLWLGVLRGNAPTASRDVATGGAVPAAGATMATTSELAALERRLRTEMAQLRTTAASSGAAAPASASETQLLARVRTLIEESEQRQQRELALRTAQVFREFDSQRQMDLAQIQRSFGQIEGLTGAEVREQRQLLNYLMRVSEQR